MENEPNPLQECVNELANEISLRSGRASSFDECVAMFLRKVVSDMSTVCYRVGYVLRGHFETTPFHMDILFEHEEFANILKAYLRRNIPKTHHVKVITVAYNEQEDDCRVLANDSRHYQVVKWGKPLRLETLSGLTYTQRQGLGLSSAEQINLRIYNYLKEKGTK